MGRLDLNLAARPFVNQRPFVIATAVAAVLLAAFTFWNIFALLEALSVSRFLKAQLVANQVERHEAIAGRDRLAAKHDERERRRIRSVAASATGIIRKRQLSWTRLLSQIETVLPRDVRILNVSPDYQGGRMSLLMQCTARDNESKLAFYRKLQEPPFSDAYIMGESLDEGKIRFSVKCEYDPEGPGAEPVVEPDRPPAAASALGPRGAAGERPPQPAPGLRRERR